MAVMAAIDGWRRLLTFCNDLIGFGLRDTLDGA
jgi:hypothetical protein